MIVLLATGVAVFSWLDLPGEVAAFAAFIFIIIVLLVALYRLRRPATEQDPNPTFDPRIRWPEREWRNPINLALARPTIESTPFLLAAGIRKARRAHSKSGGRISGEDKVDFVSIVLVIVLVGAIVTFAHKPSAVAAFLSKLGLPGELAVFFISTVVIILLIVFRVAYRSQAELIPAEPIQAEPLKARRPEWLLALALALGLGVFLFAMFVLLEF